MFFLCCLIFFTNNGRSGIPFPASSSCSAAYSRQKAPVRPTPELRQDGKTNKLRLLQIEERDVFNNNLDRFDHFWFNKMKENCANEKRVF